MLNNLTPVPIGSFQINQLFTEEFSVSPDPARIFQDQNPVISNQENFIAFSLIVPTYNESKNLGKLVEILTQLLNDYISQ